MAKTFHLSITRVDGPIFEGDALSLTLPGADGELTVMAGHEPLITPLKQGTITLRLEGKDNRVFEVERGTLEVNERVTVLL